MGSRGPIRMSNEVLIARGSSLQPSRRRAGRGRHVGGKADSLVCPASLDDEGKDIWEQVVTALEPFGHLRPADTNALARYCQTVVLHRRLVVARDDAQATDDPQTARLERRVLKLCASLLALETVLGLHPAARARLGLAPQAAAADTTGLRLVRLLPHRSDTN